MSTKFKKDWTFNVASSTSPCIAYLWGTVLQVCTVNQIVDAVWNYVLYTCTEMYYWKIVKSTASDGYQTWWQEMIKQQFFFGGGGRFPKVLVGWIKIL